MKNKLLKFPVQINSSAFSALAKKFNLLKSPTPQIKVPSHGENFRELPPFEQARSLPIFFFGGGGEYFSLVY